MRLTAQALYMDYGTTVALNYADLNLTPGIYGLPCFIRYSIFVGLRGVCSP